MMHDFLYLFLNILLKYSKHVMNRGISLLELLSEALGLNINYFKDMDCAKGLAVLCHYSPACPETELTMGTCKHIDGDFFIALLIVHTFGCLTSSSSKVLDQCPANSGGLFILFYFIFK